MVECSRMMGPSNGACVQRDGELMDKDANMNCTKVTYVPRWRWPDLAVQLFIHLGCLYGFYLILTSVKLATTAWGK